MFPTRKYKHVAYYLYTTRLKFIIIYRSIPTLEIILLNRMLLPQPPMFQVKRAMLLAREKLRVKSIKRMHTGPRFGDYCGFRSFQIIRGEGDLWHCASVLASVFRAGAHPRQPQPQMESGVHLGKSNRISLAVSYNFCCDSDSFRHNECLCCVKSHMWWIIIRYFWLFVEACFRYSRHECRARVQYADI